MSSIKITNCVINELLCFIRNNFGKHPRNDLINLCAEFYCEAEIESSKALICEIAETSTTKPEIELKKIANRKGEGKSKRDLEDILSIYNALDSKKCILPTFAATDTTRIPSLKDLDMSLFNSNLDKKISDLESLINDKFTQVNTSILSSLTSSFKEMSSSSIKAISDVDSSVNICS